ncbi:hypothetical protein, partial [Escherichia coli]|uniref:hypothetical protein n=1 Tax=Escherichia coli TaxID=562 RepID=UPI001B30A529
MSGKPAARQGDMTQYGGSIVQGSAGVRIGAPTGVACSVCPGGVTSGDRLIQETGFDGRTQRYHHDLTGKLIRSEDEGLVTHWYYDEAD